MIEHIIKLIAPHTCLDCHAPGSLLCGHCRTTLPEIPLRCYKCASARARISGICAQCQTLTPLRSVQAAVPYEATAKELVHRLKFGRAAEAAQVMAWCIVQACAVDSDVVITHVPTATNRVRRRGYDQAQLLAKYTARLAGAPYMPLLYRNGQARQVGSGRTERVAHMSGAFRAHPHAAGLQQKVLIVDDVITTGSTIEAAARTLHAAGIQDIAAITFARA